MELLRQFKLPAVFLPYLMLQPVSKNSGTQLVVQYIYIGGVYGPHKLGEALALIDVLLSRPRVFQLRIGSCILCDFVYQMSVVATAPCVAIIVVL